MMIDGGDRPNRVDMATRVNDPARARARPALDALPPASTTPKYALTPRGVAVLVALPILLIVGIGLASRDTELFTVSGIDDGSVLNAEQAAGGIVEVLFDDPADPDTVSATLGGGDVPVTVSPDGLSATVQLALMPEGHHELKVALHRPFPFGASTVTRSFSVDATPPQVEVLGPTEPARVSVPVTLRLGLDDPDATVAIDGGATTVVNGIVEHRFEIAPRAPVAVVATDAVGNSTTVPVSIPIALPGEPGQEPIRGVHASGYTWATAELRDPILAMIEEGRINTVQIDLKDESGDVWYDTSVELAHEIGAVTELWDLRQVIADLHALDVRVIGRIVNFRDPRLANHAIETQQMDLIVQNPDGTAYGKYGGFTNPYNQDVWEYNIALAEEAATLGIDDVLYDYVRRPDDYIENMRFPGQDGTPEQAVISFLEASRIRVHAAGARLGASVFGIAATRPDEVAQDIPGMSEHVDYIAPMVYPSHWGPGEYGVADPNSQPYDIVNRSMIDFEEQMRGTGASLVVWLQDFSLGVDYTAVEVRAQIDAAADAGVEDFLLWDASTTYTWAALDPQ